MQKQKKHLYILGQVADAVIYRGHRCPLLDIDKKGKEVLILVHGKPQRWVPYSEVIFAGRILSEIGNCRIGLTRRSGRRKKAESVEEPTLKLAS